MDRREIRVIRVPKWVTACLWVLLSAAMVASIDALSGRAYVQERASVAEVVEMVRKGGPEQPAALLATTAPLIADILLFVPWGALAFLVLDGEGRSRFRSYLMTLIVGAAFALGLIEWQQRFPTPVTGWVDGMWNIVGCLAGAILGHARKRMRVRFE